MTEPWNEFLTYTPKRSLSINLSLWLYCAGYCFRCVMPSEQWHQLDLVHQERCVDRVFEERMTLKNSMGATEDGKEYAEMDAQHEELRLKTDRLTAKRDMLKTLLVAQQLLGIPERTLEHRPPVVLPPSV